MCTDDYRLLRFFTLLNTLFFFRWNSHSEKFLMCWDFFWITLVAVLMFWDFSELPRLLFWGFSELPWLLFWRVGIFLNYLGCCFDVLGFFWITLVADLLRYLKMSQTKLSLRIYCLVTLKSVSFPQQQSIAIVTTLI